MNERSFIVKYRSFALTTPAGGDLLSPMPGARITAGLWASETLRDLARTNRYLVGASGGRHSVALLHALLAAGYNRVIVCHFDHQLRGRSSSADARLVARLAERHGLD